MYYINIFDGSPSHPSPAMLQDVSPDNGAQEEITAGLSGFAGSFKADGRK